VPDYVCQVTGIAHGIPICQFMPGASIDSAISGLILDTLTPLALEAALTVTDELTARAAQADQIRAAHVQRAQHAADAARRRYLAVDPANRLVADTLEADWNDKLRELAATQDDYDKARRATTTGLGDTQRDRIRALAADFPALWNHPATPMRERKRLIRLLITDVTLIKTGGGTTVHVRWRGGQDHSMTLPLPLNAWQERKTPQATIDLIDQLLDEHTYGEVAGILTQRGITSGEGRTFTAGRLRAHCDRYRLRSHYQRLRETGLLTLDEIAGELGAHPSSIKRWYRLVGGPAFSGQLILCQFMLRAAGSGTRRELLAESDSRVPNGDACDCSGSRCTAQYPSVPFLSSGRRSGAPARPSPRH
jgi:hypothetical protein